MVSAWVAEIKAAMYLSNTGIAMLGHQCFHDGIRTLGDAVAVMKEVSSQIYQAESTVKQSTAPFPSDGCCASTRNKLNAAAKQLSSPHNQAGPTERVAVQEVSFDYSLLLTSPPPIGRSEPSPSGSAAVAESKNSGTLTILPVLRLESTFLEEIELLGADPSNETTVIASVILYNYGIAYRCLACLPTSIDLQENLAAASFRLFQLAYSAVTGRYCLPEDANRYPLSVRGYQFVCILLLAIKVLDQLTEISFQLGMKEMNKEYSDCRNWLGQVLVCFQFNTVQAAMNDSNAPAA